MSSGIDRTQLEASESKGKYAFPTWRTIKLGTHKSVGGLVEALEKGYKIGDWAADILKKVTLASSPEEIELVVVSVADLGFEKGASRKDIYDRALSLGLTLCSAEVGPALRLQYQDQPNGEWLLIAMEPITVSDGNLHVFHVEHDGSGRWLDSYDGHPDYVWNPDHRWVFSRSKKYIIAAVKSDFLAWAKRHPDFLHRYDTYWFVQNLVGDLIRWKEDPSKWLEEAGMKVPKDAVTFTSHEPGSEGEKTIIDCDASPWCPNDWKVEEHQKGGQIEFDPAKISFHLDDSQKDGRTIEGNQLRKKLEGKPVMNACVLDHLLANTALIPESWKVDEQGRTRYTYFWGTVYRGSSGFLYVRCLFWRGGLWHWDYYWLVDQWGDRSPAAVMA